MPPRIKPELRGEIIEVPGRHGSLFESEEVYNSKTLTIECTFIPNNKSDEEINQMMLNLPLWLDGSGKLILSDYPHLYYDAKIINAIPIDRLFKRYRKFVVAFEVQPFSKTIEEYEITKTTTEEENFEINSFYPVNPEIELVGSGDITLNINHQSIHIKNLESKIIIDCEFMNATNVNGTNANNKVSGLPLAISKQGCNISITLGTNATFDNLKMKYRGLWI